MHTIQCLAAMYNSIVLAESISAATATYDTAQDDVYLQQNPAYATVPSMRPISTATDDTAQDDNVYLQQNPAYATVPPMRPIANVHQE